MASNKKLLLIVIIILLLPGLFVFSRLSFLAGPIFLIVFLFLLFLMLKKAKTNESLQTESIAAEKPEKTSDLKQAESSVETKPKKNRKFLVTIIVVCCLVLGIFLFWKFAGDRFDDIGSGNSENKGTIDGEIPEGDPDKAVSKEIGKDGGEISVQTGSGRTATLRVPPGALNGNRVIVVTPVAPNNPGGSNNDEEDDGSNGRNNPDDPGGNNPDNNDPGNPDDNDPDENDPGGSGNETDPAQDEPGIIITPTDLHFDIPAWVSFTWNTSLTAGAPSGGGTSYPDFSSITSGGTLDLSMFQGIGGIPSSVSYGNNSGLQAKTATSDRSNSGTMIFTDHAGKVSVVPSFGGSDGSFGGPVNGGGAIEPQNSGGQDNKDNKGNKGNNGGNSLPDNAAAKSGGKCSEEFLLAASQMMKNAATKEEKSDYSSAIKDCLDIEWLKNLCQNNKIKLRRAYFEQRMPLAMKYDPAIADELRQLEASCVGQYSINVSKGNLGREGTFSFSASLCGYVDDEWDANMKYRVNLAKVIIHQYDGSGKFMLPYTGGALIPGKADGLYEVYAAGNRVFSQKLNAINVMAYLHNNTNTLDFTLMNMEVQTGVPIVLDAGNACVDPHSQPPLEPLGPGNDPGNKPPVPDDELPPLEPLVPDGNDQSDEQVPDLVPLVPDDQEPPLKPLVH